VVELEYQADQVDQHDIWISVEHKDLTPDEVEEFRSEMESMISNLKDELSSLEDKVQDALDELVDALPRCTECGEILTDDNRDEDIFDECEDCVEGSK
jgi:hypothetical protein